MQPTIIRPQKLVLPRLMTSSSVKVMSLLYAGISDVPVNPHYDSLSEADGLLQQVIHESGSPKGLQIV